MTESNLEYIQLVLSLSASPACKLALITLIIEDRPLTTRELNLNLSLNKTFKNYLDLFSDMISIGVIRTVKQKTKAGILREHFEIKLDTLNDLVEE